GLPPQAQAVTDAAYGVDQRRLLEVDLLAQVADVVLNNAGVAAEVVAPDVVDDLRLRHHPPRVQQQVAKQVELRRRQLDRLPAAGLRGPPRPPQGRRPPPARAAGPPRSAAPPHVLGRPAPRG